MNQTGQPKLIVIRKSPRPTSVLVDDRASGSVSEYAEKREMSFMDENNTASPEIIQFPGSDRQASQRSNTQSMMNATSLKYTYSVHSTPQPSTLELECIQLRLENARLRAELDESRAVNKELLRSCQVMRSSQLIR